jgi:hypothetical protein
MSSDGPQVFSRPGTKRHLKQVRARATYLAIQAVYAEGRAKRAQAAHEAAAAAHAALLARIDEVASEILAVAEPAGRA